MDKQFPLYPKLKEAGKEEAQHLFDEFKSQMKKICDEILSRAYTDVAIYIESDSWGNFRNEIIQGFSKYGNRKLQSDYDFAKIRQAIFEEHREEIIKECEKDIVEENENLKKELQWLRELAHRG